MIELSGKKTVRNETHGEERAFYGAVDTRFEDCVISGEEDGESAFKESVSIEAARCEFALRYPFWHGTGVVIEDCVMRETCRAPIWYCKDVTIADTCINGVKAVRECRDITVKNVKAVSAEFGWKTVGIQASDSYIEGEYLFLDSGNIALDNVHIKGKYSFQYVENAVIRGCKLDTKDAFWHSRNVTVYDSEVSGEYLGWYSEALRLVRCRISGTQPLCYANGLVLEDCTMMGCDLAFENSTVNATVTGNIDSIKNPLGGSITAGSVGEVISEDAFERKRCTSLTLTEGGAADTLMI